MPTPVPTPVRQVLWQRWTTGAKASELSLSFGLNPRTVRKLLQRWRQQGSASLQPSYPRATSPPPVPDHPAFEPAVALRQVHPCWGAVLIRIYLEDQGIQQIPCARTLQRWFQRFGLGPAPAGCKPTADRRARQPHDIWQVDAAEEIALANRERVSWLRIVDEFSGAVLHTAIFPPRPLEFGTCKGLSG
jgi:transposase